MLYKNKDSVVSTEKTGMRIRRLMQRLNLKDLDISRELHVSVQAVCNWRNGKKLPDHQNLVDLAIILGTTTDYLLMGNVVTDHPCEMYMSHRENERCENITFIDVRNHIVIEVASQDQGFVREDLMRRLYIYGKRIAA